MTKRSQGRGPPELGLINWEDTTDTCRISITQTHMGGFILIAVTPQIPFCSGHTSVL